ncbi:MAG TPA: Gfo/Idh/MocA family oxidoreductase [Chloroflexaceae bacterium]|nr:Gfo/Idh/MocA family oxidoreductase [Chloroflexaceae bacterium]
MTQWGIIGTGRIARKFAQALAGAPGERVVAAASRDEARAETFARELGIPRGYGSYEALLADPEVGQIYLALPNALHAEWAARAAAAGKHVLCEKPIATSAAEAEQMFAAARRHGVWLMEAFMYRFHPQTLRLQELLAAGAVGEVRLVRASFAFSVSDPANVRLSAELAGGALMDVGCYCVNAARMVVGQRPARAFAAATWAPSGVDETLAGTLEYPSGALAQVACSLRASRHHQLQVVGSDGILELDEVFTVPANRPTLIRLVRGAAQDQIELVEVPPAEHFRLEAEGFSALVAAGHGATGLPEMPLAETLDNAATIDALLRSAREGRPVVVAP